MKFVNTYAYVLKMHDVQFLEEALKPKTGALQILLNMCLNLKSLYLFLCFELAQKKLYIFQS